MFAKEGKPLTFIVIDNFKYYLEVILPFKLVRFYYHYRVINKIFFLNYKEYFYFVINRLIGLPVRIIDPNYSNCVGYLH